MRLSPLVLVLAVTALAAGCDPGSLYDDPVYLGDGGVFVCEPPAAAAGDGHHNAGQGCLTSGCHRNGGGPEFTFGGTLYDDRYNGGVVAGATIVVIDGDGNTIKVVTASNGNFYSNQPVVMPLLVRASSCPLNRSMVSLSQSGDCNVGGCHGSADPRAYLR